MTTEQLPLFAHGLAPLKLGDVVQVIAEDWIGEVAQVWPGRDWYAVFAFSWPGSAPGRTITAPLPTYRRDELELRGEEDRAEVWKRYR